MRDARSAGLHWAVARIAVSTTRTLAIALVVLALAGLVNELHRLGLF